MNHEVAALGAIRVQVVVVGAVVVQVTAAGALVVQGAVVEALVVQGVAAGALVVLGAAAEALVVQGVDAEADVVRGAAAGALVVHVVAELTCRDALEEELGLRIPGCAVENQLFSPSVCSREFFPSQEVLKSVAVVTMELLLFYRVRHVENTRVEKELIVIEPQNMVQT